MFGKRGPPPHYDFSFRLCHPRPMPIDHLLMLPAMNLAPPSLVGQTTRAQRTFATDRLEGSIANVQFAARVLFITFHRPQFCPCRAMVDVLLSVVAELFQGEATLLGQAIVLVGFRH